MFLPRLLVALAAAVLSAGELNPAWIQKRDLPEPRIFEIATSIDGAILAVTSGEDGKPGTEVFAYNTVADTWTRRAHANLVRHSFGAAMAGGKIFIWGGIAGAKLTASTEVYDPKTDTWTTLSPMPEPRIFAKGAEVAGKLYAVGGIQPPGRNQVPLLHEYDPKTDRWSAKAYMPQKRDAYRVAAVNGKIYVIGNLGGSSRVLEYTPATDAWAVRSPMPTARFDFGIHASGGSIYTFGGMGSRDLEIYQPAADRWITKRPMPRNNWCQVVAESHGKFYMIGGGFPAPEVIRTVYEYNPALDR